MIAGLNLFRGSAVWALASWAESGLLANTRWGYAVKSFYKVNLNIFYIVIDN